MDDHTKFVQEKKRLGFLYNFAIAAIKQNETLTMRLPQNSLFRLIVTVTATQPDADHQKQPLYKKVTLKKEDVPFYDILVKSRKASKSIFTTMIQPGYDKRRIPDSSNLSDMTVGISGSKQTPGSKRTMDKVSQSRKEEDVKGIQRIL